jgi:hypothetical protein
MVPPNILTIVLFCVYILGMLFFCVAFLVDWIRLRKCVKQYWKSGLWAGLAVVGSDLILIIICPTAHTELLLCAFAALPVMFIKVFGFTTLGMHYCGFLGYPSFSFIKRKKNAVAANSATMSPGVVTDGVPQPATANVERVPPSDTALSGSQFPAIAPMPTALECAIVPPAIDIKRCVASVIAVVVAAVMYSIVLFAVTNPQVTEAARRFLETESPGEQNQVTLFTVFFLLVVAAAEELSFRLSIQSFMVRYLHLREKQYWIAVCLTAFLWAAGHAGTLDPEWVKMAQIFPIGILLGWLFKKYGVESCIIAHGAFNLILALTATNLVR